MFDLLLSADFMVPDPDATTRRFVERLGLPEQKPAWRQGFTDHAYVAWFLRVHKSLAVAPTRLEPQGHRVIDRPSKDPLFAPYLDHLAEYQGRARPMKTHATVLITRELPELMEKLARRKLPFRVAPLDDAMPWDRVWLGVTGDDPRYEPSVDGGLIVEVMADWPLQLPDATWSKPPPLPRDPGPGEYVRVQSRGVLVQDVEETVRLLSLNLDWEPLGSIESVPEEGYRRATMGFTMPHSATVEILQPTHYDCAPGRYLATWGPGPYHVRLAVHGLEARADDLATRGVRFDWMPESRAVEGRRLRIHPDELDGALFELVEFQP